MKILFIGDPHIKTDNHEEIDILILELKKICESNHFDHIIIGGDLMHYHERIFTQALNKSLEFVTCLSIFAPVHILVGNHDMINNQQFLTSNHWLNVFTHYKNVKIVEKPIVLKEKNKDSTFTFLMCPYVYPGRFIEAIETVSNDWKTYNVIFAHQEFKGCKMGAIVSKDGDEWSEEFPQIISGHIHDNQTPQKNIYYPGSPLQHAFGDTDKRVVCIIDEKGVITNLNLDVPKKTIVKKTVSDILGMIDKNNTELHSHLKIKLTATPEEFKVFKQTHQYKECIEKGVKIQLDAKPIKREESTTIIEQTNFRLLLQHLVETDGDSLLKKIYTDILA
jgi:DNA repair exonuclease SbcCD nuclease subunit